MNHNSGQNGNHSHTFGKISKILRDFSIGLMEASVRFCVS